MTASTLAALAAATRVLHEAGAGLLLGSDTINPFVVPGFSIHEELRHLTDAGLTPYEALVGGTRNAARFLQTNDFGTVQTGARADLILLDANPLEDVANFKRRVGVMTRGVWLTEADLQVRLNALAESIAAAP
jgi:imidazolonepropionase-like amidohydrolase